MKFLHIALVLHVTESNVYNDLQTLQLHKIYYYGGYERGSNYLPWYRSVFPYFKKLCSSVIISE